MRPVVIGSGIGGLATALILKKKGFRPIVFEKEKRWGGSFTSYQMGDYIVDTGLHLLTRGSTGELPVLMRKYMGSDIFQKKFVKQKEYRIHLGETDDKMPSNLPEIMGFRLIPLGDRIRFARMLVKFLRMGRENSNFDGTTYEYVRKYLKSDEILYFLNGISWMCNGCSIKEGSLPRFVDTFIRKKKFSFAYAAKHASSKGNASEEDWYPKGGLVTVPKLFLNQGLEVQTEKNVEKIVVENNKVIGVKVGGRFYRSYIVVYDGFVKDLGKMIEGGRLQIEKPRSEPYYALTVWFGFEKKVADWDRVSRLRLMESMDSPHWCCFVSDFEPKMAPPGHQLLGVSAILHKEKKKMVREIKQTVEKFIPGYEKHVDMEHIQVCMAEKTLHREGNNFFSLPEQKTNIEGLYVVGTDTKGWGSGGTLCADSAMRCWKSIKNDINAKNS